MKNTLAIGDNVICSLVPGKRYVLQVSVSTGTAVAITPLQTETGAEVPGSKFTSTPDSIEVLAWSFDGVTDASAGFEFTATRRELTLNSSAALDVDVECYPIED